MKEAIEELAREQARSQAEKRMREKLGACVGSPVQKWQRNSLFHPQKINNYLEK